MRRSRGREAAARPVFHPGAARQGQPADDHVAQVIDRDVDALFKMGRQGARCGAFAHRGRAGQQEDVGHKVLLFLLSLTSNDNPSDSSALRSFGIEAGPMPCSARISDSLNPESCSRVVMPLFSNARRAGTPSKAKNLRGGCAPVRKPGRWGNRCFYNTGARFCMFLDVYPGLSLTRFPYHPISGGSFSPRMKASTGPVTASPPV